MKKLFTLVVVLLVAGAVSLWAGGQQDTTSYQFTQAEINWEELASLQVDPSAEIVAIFEENGVDSMYLMMDRENQFINSSVRGDIDDIIDDDADGVIALIKNELKKYLKEDHVEYVYMVLGTKLFSVKLGQ